MIKKMVDSIWYGFLTLLGIYHVKYYGAKGDGVTDDTDAINRAVEAANNWTDAGLHGTRYFPLDINKRGGVVYFPPGVFNVRSINIKSGIVYRGAGTLSTRLNPIGTSGYVFDREATEQFIGVVTFEDFTIAPNDEHFAFVGKAANPAKAGGFNFNLVSAAYVNRVNMSNLDGIGFRLAECYDSYFNNIEIMFVGKDESTPAIGMYSGIQVSSRVPDLTNAIHMSQVRVEDCPTGVEINGQIYSNKLLREIQFVGCKFEGAPIRVMHTFGVTFSACHFTPHGSFNQTDTPPSIPHVVIGDTGADTRGVQFVGCSYISGSSNSRWMFDIRGVSTYDFKIIGASVTGIKNFLTAAGQKIHIVGLTAVTCGTPFIQSTERLRVSDCSFFNMLGGDYVLVSGDKSIITKCDFDRVDKAISMDDNCVSEYNFFKDIYVHAHYVANGGNIITHNRDDGGVAKMIEYAVPSLNLITFKTEQLVTPAPAGYNEQTNPLNVGVSNNYGAKTDITGNGYRYFTLPQIKVVVGGNVNTGAAEAITVKIQANYDDGTNAFTEKTMNAVGSAWLDPDAIASIVRSRLQIRSFAIYAKSSAPSTSATASVKVLANIH